MKFQIWKRLREDTYAGLSGALPGWRGRRGGQALRITRPPGPD